MSRDSKREDVKFIKDFVYSSLGGMVVGGFLYRSLLFRKIAGLSLFASELLFWLIVITMSVIGVFVEVRKKDILLIDDRNFEDVMIGCGIYSIIAYSDVSWIKIVLMFMFMSLGIYASALLSRKIRRKQYKKKIICGRLKRVGRFSYGLVFAGTTVIVMGLYFGGLFQELILSTRVDNRQETATGETIEGNIEILSRLKDWEDISINEKLEVLQVVAQIECDRLGISEDLNIVLDDHMMVYEVGYYDDRNGRIVLNSLTVKGNSAWYTLEALLHEIYHSYEHRLADVFEKLNRDDQKLLLFQEAKQYYNEFFSYVIPEIDWVGYSEQKCEVDAREFAERRVEIYYTNVTDGYFAKQN